MTDILILEKARVALQRQHDWHLNRVRRQLHPADKYADSEMYDETVAALDLLSSEIKRRTGG